MISFPSFYRFWLVYASFEFLALLCRPNMEIIYFNSIIEEAFPGTYKYEYKFCAAVIFG